MIGMMVPNVSAEISYPTFSQRLDELPTYCIIDPVDLSTAERTKYTNLAKRGIQEWDRALQSSGADNTSNWKINSKIISSSDSVNNCTIVLSFHETIQQLDNVEDARTIGIFFPMIQSIRIATQDILIDQMFNVILHEIGHSFGLGHYVSDDPETNAAWYSGLVSSPSIMIPVLTSELMSIEDVDVQRVFSIYGSDGFFAFSPQSPISPLLPSPTPIKPIIPILPFDDILIMDTEILLKPYETKYSKIVGQIKESVYKKGHLVYITIIKPDNTFDALKITPTRSGYFEVPLIFDKHSPTGYYTVEASYIDHRDDSMDFVFFADFKHSSPKIEEEIVKEVEIKEEEPVTEVNLNSLFPTSDQIRNSDWIDDCIPSESYDGTLCWIHPINNDAKETLGKMYFPAGISLVLIKWDSNSLASQNYHQSDYQIKVKSIFENNLMGADCHSLQRIPYPELAITIECIKEHITMNFYDFGDGGGVPMSKTDMKKYSLDLFQILSKNYNYAYEQEKITGQEESKIAQLETEKEEETVTDVNLNSLFPTSDQTRDAAVTENQNEETIEEESAVNESITTQ